MTKFIITCAARTGSTMFRYLLDDHPQIACHGEVFKAKGLVRFLQKDRRPFGLTSLYENMRPEFEKCQVSDFISNHLLNDNQSSINGSGFKFKTEEYFQSLFTEVSSYVKSRTDIKVIHLRRKDLLAQYISHLMVKNKKTETVVFEKSEAKQVDQLTLSSAKVLAFMQDVEDRENRIVEEMKDHDMMEVNYEDLIKNQAQELSHIQTFLGVETQSLNPKTQKILSNHYAMIKNKSAIIAAISSSEFSDRIRSTQV